MTKIFNNELGSQAYKRVKDMIMSKELSPGEKIVQDKLAEELGISRTPLRSALQMLEGEGLIIANTGKGVSVKEFTDTEIVEIFDCRMALESTAVRLFTERARPSEIQELRDLFTPFLNGDIDEANYQKADAQFHDTIIKQSGNSFLYRLFQQGNLLMCMDLIGLLRLPNETLPEHIEIIDAMDKRDSTLVESLAISHLNKTKKLILKRINEKKR